MQPFRGGGCRGAQRSSTPGAVPWVNTAQWPGLALRSFDRLLRAWRIEPTAHTQQFECTPILIISRVSSVIQRKFNTI